MHTLFQEAETMDAELNIGTGVILSLFFGATLVSAVFFGLGYSFGVTHGVTASTFSLHAWLHSSTQSAATTTSAPAPATSSSAPVAEPPAPVQSSIASANSAALQTAPAQEVASLPEAGEMSSSAVLGDPSLPSTSHAAAVAYSVQIAASASRKDAQFLIAKLRRAGLHARIHHEVQDKFYRVQIGPFTSRSDATAMRTKVLAAGFKAILKSN